MDMKLSDTMYGKTSTPNATSSSAKEASALPSIDGNLSNYERRALQVRLIKEDICMRMLQQKQLEEEVMAELFGEDYMKVKNSLLPSDHPQATIKTGEKPVSDAGKGVPLPLSTPSPSPRPSPSPSPSPLPLPLSSPSPSLLPLPLPLPLSLLLPSPLSSLSSLPSPLPLRVEASTIGLIQGGASPEDCDWHDERPVTRAEREVTDDYPFKRHPGARTKPKMLINLVKGTSAPSRRNITPVISDLGSSDLPPEVTEKPIELAASVGNTHTTIAEHVKENLKAQIEDRNKLSSGSPAAEKLNEPTKLAASEYTTVQVEDFTKLNSGPPPAEKHETIPSKVACGTKRNITPVEEDCCNVTASANCETKKQKKWECELCQMEMNSEHQFTMHFHGKNHLKNKTRQLAKATKGSIEEKQEVAKFESCNTIPKIWFCNMCKFETTTEEAMRNHQTGDQHMALLRTFGGNLIVVTNTPDDVQNVDVTQ